MFPTTGASKELSAPTPRRKTTEDICPQAPHGTSKTSKSGRAGPGASYSSISRGVYMASDVYVSGQRAGGHPYGYSSFFCDITPYLKPGRNTIAVKADNSRQKNCRWYSGSGIYRHVWLINTEPTHIANHGIYVVSRNLGNDNWSLDIESDICTATDDKRRLEVRHTLADASGNTVATANGAKTAVTVKSPSLWSPDSPTLYTLTTELLADGKPIDRRSTTTGFRSISYDSADGLTLNGRPIVLNGGCLPPRQRHPRSRRLRPRRDTQSRAYERSRVQRRAHIAQPAVRGIPQRLRQHRPPRDRRSIRRLARRQESLRLLDPYRHLLAGRHRGNGAARPQSPLNILLEHRQRDNRSAKNQK